MKHNPPRAYPSQIMAAIRKAHHLTVNQAWGTYRKLRDLFDEPLSLRKLKTYAETVQAAAHDVAPRRVPLPEVLTPAAEVPTVRLPDFPPEAPPVVQVPAKAKFFHDVTARITGPANATPDTIKNVWWRVASGHGLDVFRLRIVNWRKRDPDTDVIKEYVYEALNAASALENAKALAIVQRGRKALRVARVSIDEYNDVAEFEITLYYWEEA
jgi:hypothetical protein